MRLNPSKSQNTLCRGMLDLGASEVTARGSRSRVFFYDGAKYYVRSRSIRQGLTLASSRPVPLAFYWAVQTRGKATARAVSWDIV